MVIPRHVYTDRAAQRPDIGKGRLDEGERLAVVGLIGRVHEKNPVGAREDASTLRATDVLRRVTAGGGPRSRLHEKRRREHGGVREPGLLVFWIPVDG